MNPELAHVSFEKEPITTQNYNNNSNIIYRAHINIQSFMCSEGIVIGLPVPPPPLPSRAPPPPPPSA